MALIVPTPAFRRLVHSRRAHPLAPAPPLGDGNAFREAWQRFESLRTFWLQGIERSAGEPLGVLMREAAALLEGAPWPDDLDVARAAAAERMLNGSASLVPAVAARFGTVAALRVKLQSAAYGARSGRDKNVGWRALAPSDASAPGVFEIGWKALRSAMCAADAHAYTSARDLAAGARERADAFTRGLIAFAFPGEPAWANEELRAANAAADFTKHVHLRSALLASANDEALCADFLVRCEPWGSELAMRFACDLVLGLGPDVATRVLLAELRRALGRRARAAALFGLAAALTSIRSETVASAFAPLLRHDALGRHVVAYFERAPMLARHALSPMADAKSLLGDAARYVLASGQDRPSGDEVATPSEWPAALRDAPWRHKPREAHIALSPLPCLETIAWSAGEREAILEAAAAKRDPGGGATRIMTPADRAEFEALPYKCIDVWLKWDSGHWTAFAIPDELALQLWKDPSSRLQRERPIYVLAKFGDEALGGLFARDPFGENVDLFDAYLHVDSPRVAPVCARAMVRRKAWRRTAMRWLVSHPEAAATGLVPNALATAKARAEAERGLLFLAAHGHANLVRHVAERHGAEALAAIAQLLDRDPLAHIDVEGRVSMSYVRLEGLPVLRLRSGRALPAEAVGRVVEILRGMRGEVPYVGIAPLRDALDPDSAAELAWALLLTWDLHGHRRVDEWMARALAAFHNDDTVGRLVAYAKQWAQRDSSACILALEILASVGNESALLHLAAIAEGSGLDSLHAIADETLGDEAARDRLVPALNLDARGTARFDLGTRAVTMSLDETLRPVAWLDDGRRLAQLPRPSKEDDPASAAKALSFWRVLCRDALVIAETQPRRFERAMVAGRRLAVAELDRIAHHPVLGHLARRLVWGVFSPELTATFRVADDGTLTDADDRECSLPPAAQVGIVHPIALSEPLRARWSALFADYEILQPFEQLARQVQHPDAGVAASGSIRMAAEPVAAAALVALFDARGWKRVSTGYLRYAWHELRVRGDGREKARAMLTFSPGTVLADIARAKPQKLSDVSLVAAKSFAEVDEVDMSELLRDLDAWRARP